MSDSTPTVVGQKSDVPRCRSGCIAYDINTLFATASGRLYDAVGIRQRWRAISLTGLLCQPSPPCPRQPSPPCLRQPSPPWGGVRGGGKLSRGFSSPMMGWMSQKVNHKIAFAPPSPSPSPGRGRLSHCFFSPGRGRLTQYSINCRPTPKKGAKWIRRCDKKSIRH